MIITYTFRLFSLLALAVALVAIPAQSTFAQSGGDGDRVRMATSLSGVKAVARYEERGSRRKFNFQLELGTPGQVGTVTAVAANGATVTMGTFTVNSLRRGIIDIDTTEGNSVADLNVGSKITLSIGGNSYSGTLSLR